MKPTILNRLDSAKITFGITAIIFFFLVILVVDGVGPSYSIKAGDQFADPNLVPKELVVQRNSVGYDGQFFYRLALNPFTSVPTEFGITLDNPPYRQQRIVYPLIVWVLSLGRANLVPILLILVNYIGLCALGWLGGLYAQSLNLNALWGLVFPFYPGFLLTLFGDLAEILAMTFLLAGLLLIRRREALFAAFLLSLAVLSKETVLLVAVAGLLVWLSETWNRKNGNQPQWYLYSNPLVSWFIWQLNMLRVWGQIPFLVGSGNLGIPFQGFVGFGQMAVTQATPYPQLTFIELCFLSLFALSVLYSMRSTTASSFEKLSWLLYVGLALLLTKAVWVGDWAFLRALSEFYLLGTIIILGSPLRIKIPVFALALVLWLLVFVGRV